MARIARSVKAFTSLKTRKVTIPCKSLLFYGMNSYNSLLQRGRKTRIAPRHDMPHVRKQQDDVLNRKDGQQIAIDLSALTEMVRRITMLS